MTKGAALLSELEVRTGVLDGRARTFLVIDGVDVLDLQQPVLRPDGSRYPDGPKVYLPADPDSLLPPDSAILLPAEHPKHAMIGVCDCGEPGCGSLWLQVRREGDTVCWEPDPHSPWASIDRTWSFALRPYLDAIDAGQRSTLTWQTRPRRLARELRRRRDSLFGFQMINAVTHLPMRLLNAKAWPGQDDILIEVASDQGVRQLLFAVSAERTDEQLLRSLMTIDPARFE